MNVIPVSNLSEIDLYSDKLLTDLNWFETNEFKLSDNFAGIKIHIAGDNFDSSISTTVMKAIIRLQESIYRQYSLLAYQKIKKLSFEEQAMLELYAKIEPGSSWIAIFVETVLQNIAEKIKAMTPKQTMSTIAIVAVAATLSLATNKIVDYQTKIKELEIQAKTATDTAKILAQTQIETIKAQTEFYKEIAKQTNAQIEIDDEKIDPDQIKAITNQVRSKATKTHHVLEGDYKVTDIHIADDWVSIDVIGTDGSVIKDINLLETFINQDDYKLIKESANRAFMPMKILLTMKGDKIETATLSEIQ